jgi:hypothetical protein
MVCNVVQYKPGMRQWLINALIVHVDLIKKDFSGSATYQELEGTSLLQSYFCRRANDVESPRNRLASLEKSCGKATRRKASRKRSCKAC